MKKSLEFKNFDFEIKSVEANEDGDLIIEGYGSKFGNVDSYKDIVAKGAFTKTLNENADRIAFCYQHDLFTPIGKIQNIKEDDYGLFISVKVSNAKNCESYKTQINEGILKELSIGYTTVKSIRNEETGVRTLVEVKLWEISLVTIAANSMAAITGIKSIEDKQNAVEEQIDRLIAMERSKEKKYELTKLKALIEEELPSEETSETQPKSEPPAVVDESKQIDFAKIIFK